MDQYFSETVKAAIRTVPDWPKAGVSFRDITPALQNRSVFRKLIDAFVHRYHGQEIDVIASVDARGFILGAPLAYELNASFVPVRKKGKLPFETVSAAYQLEYGEAEVELHKDAVQTGDRVLLVDDLIATGGTLLAAANLITQLGGDILECAAVIDLPDLGGSARLKQEGHAVFAVCEFAGD